MIFQTCSIHPEAVDVRAVPLEVRLLLEPLLADVADVLRDLPAFVAHVPTQGVLPGVGSSAGVAGIGFSVVAGVPDVSFAGGFQLCNGDKARRQTVIFQKTLFD